MRFLKNKIFRAQDAQKRQSAKVSLLEDEVLLKTETSSLSNDICHSENTPIKSNEYSQKHSRRSQTPLVELPISQNDTCLKNIAINYGKAIASFSASNLAAPYLEALLAQEKVVTLHQFQKFANQEKTKIGGMSSLRNVLVVGEGDDEKMAACKKMFRVLSEVFIKYFSVNWILTGRLSHKMAYLKFRGKMLRRVQNPESFTYIKERQPTKGKKRTI
jgi:hypothetical protein